MLYLTPPDLGDKLGTANGSAPLRELENAQKLIERIAALGDATPTEESVALADKASDAICMWRGERSGKGKIAPPS